MCGDGVEGGDVVQTKLAESGLQNFDAWGRINGTGGDGVRSSVGSGVVDRFDDLVDLGGDKRVCKII